MNSRCLLPWIVVLIVVPANLRIEAQDSSPSAIPWRGMAIQLTRGPDALTVYRPLVREVAELGANTLLLCVAGQMEHARSQAIYVDARGTPSRDDLLVLIAVAREERLNVVLMPIVLLKHPRGSEWRGVIDPPDWERWWRDYRDFIQYFAEIAERGGVEAFLVGSELVSTERHAEEWETTIRTARAQYTKGLLGYSANWDHYKPIKFWHLLDFIGLTTYYTLADRKNPTMTQIVERWQTWRNEILAWRAVVDKPLILTEVGWCSQEGAATAPWNYYKNMKATPAGHEEQRRLYEAFLQAWDPTPELLGVCWWEWTPAPGGPDDYNYTPRNKPAEQVLRRWFAEQKASSASAKE